jgi:hypothetical protein
MKLQSILTLSLRQNNEDGVETGCRSFIVSGSSSQPPCLYRFSAGGQAKLRISKKGIVCPWSKKGVVCPWRKLCASLPPHPSRSGCRTRVGLTLNKRWNTESSQAQWSECFPPFIDESRVHESWCQERSCLSRTWGRVSMGLGTWWDYID